MAVRTGRLTDRWLDDLLWLTIEGEFGVRHFLAAGPTSSRRVAGRPVDGPARSGRSTWGRRSTATPRTRGPRRGHVDRPPMYGSRNHLWNLAPTGLRARGRGGTVADPFRMLGEELDAGPVEPDLFGQLAARRVDRLRVGQQLAPGRLPGVGDAGSPGRREPRHRRSRPASRSPLGKYLVSHGRAD